MQYLNNLFVNGKALSDYGVMVTDAKIYNSPQPQYEKVEIEGRNGDLLIEKNRFTNFAVEYPAYIGENFKANYTALRSFLMSLQGYVRLEDSFNRDRFRLGRFMGEIAPDLYNNHQSKLFTLKFWCKPQWFYKSGENVMTFTDSMTVYNPAYQNALPLIRVYGDGTLTVGANTITIATGATQYVDIDSEIMDCYEGANNRNSIVSMTAGYPAFEPGATTLTASGNITSVEVTPRWWTL